jgi:hypothetical protein
MIITHYRQGNKVEGIGLFACSISNKFQKYKEMGL